METFACISIEDVKMLAKVGRLGKHLFMSKIILAAAALLLSSTSVHAAPAGDALHGWASGTPDGLKAWTQGWLDEEKAAIAAIKAVQGKRTIANTLVPFDKAQNALTIASSQTGVLYEVADTAAMRDAGQALTQTVSTANTQLNLDRGVYDALVALAATAEAKAADPATRHYLDRTLLEYRLAGVDRDEATRAKIQQLQDRITALSLSFGRNVQDGTLKIQTSAEHLAGLPEDYLARHKPDDKGVVTLTTEQPDVIPVLKFASDAGLRRQMVLAYGNRAYPANEQVLKDLLIARQELATTLGFATWADFATADQMMGSTKALKSFLGDLDVASRPIAAQETAALTAFAAKTDPKAGP
jgi:thimet oligopeptidase